MELQEKTLHSETIYDGKILHIRRDTVLLPNGREAIREVAEHTGLSKNELYAAALDRR